MRINAVRASDITRCPKRSLLPAHYRDDGTCRCDEHTQAVEDVKAAEQVRRDTLRDTDAALRAARQRARET